MSSGLSVLLEEPMRHSGMFKKQGPLAERGQCELL